MLPIRENPLRLGTARTAKAVIKIMIPRTMNTMVFVLVNVM
jgi:hypothetical protein